MRTGHLGRRFAQRRTDLLLQLLRIGTHKALGVHRRGGCRAYQCIDHPAQVLTLQIAAQRVDVRATLPLALKVDGNVGAQSGFSVVDQLKGLGVKVDDAARSADDNLKKLVAGRFGALALQTEEGDISIESNPEFKGKVERIKTVLVEKPYFLIFSKQFTSKNAAYVQEVWDSIGKVRESAEYVTASKNFK
jgi:hypothetical protein